jgi:hypothetical protein
MNDICTTLGCWVYIISCVAIDHKRSDHKINYIFFRNQLLPDLLGL